MTNTPENPDNLDETKNKKYLDFTDQERQTSDNLYRIWHSQTPKSRVTQNKAARALGISQPAISKYLNGYLRLNMATTLQFAALLNVPPAQIDETLGPIMRKLKPEYVHALTIQTNQYAPRIFEGDAIVLDALHKPKNNGLCVAYTSPTDLHIGYYQETTKQLIHPITRIAITPDSNYIIQPISSIIPGAPL